MMRMGKLFLFSVSVSVSGVLLLTSCHLQSVTSGESPTLRPTQGASRSIGSYNNGCLEGGVGLAEAGEGFFLLLPQTQRKYGHPTLVAFLLKLGTWIKGQKWGELGVGDLSLPRGGPMPSGHRSHQSGLDVDIRYRLANSLAEKRKMSVDAHSVLTPEGTLDSQRFGEVQLALLSYVASQPEVDRIFVSRHIKKLICEKTNGDLSLKKIRAWWGHDDHFHVRLKCPSDSLDCEPSKVIAHQSCGEELAWWFGSEAEQGTKSGGSAEPLPSVCQEILTVQN